MAQYGKSSSVGSSKLPIYKDLVLLQLAALVFLTDQFTKFLVRSFLDFRESIPEEGFFRITHTFNTGAAFGIFQDQNSGLIFVSIIGIAVLVFIYISQPVPSPLLRLSLGLQLGGASGNLLDRVRLDHVTDFIVVGSWPVFNLADASIVSGLVLLGWIFLRPGSNTPSVAPGPEELPHYGCPICDGDMMRVNGGWRCGNCGVRERVDTGIDQGRNVPAVYGNHRPMAWGDAPCVLCEGEMLPLNAAVWRCDTCGVREVIAPSIPIPEEMSAPVASVPAGLPANESLAEGGQSFSSDGVGPDGTILGGERLPQEEKRD